MNNSFMNLSVMPERTFDNPYEKQIPHQDRVYAKCDWCGAAIYCGEHYFSINGNKICDREECVEELTEQLLDKYKKFAF